VEAGHVLAADDLGKWKTALQLTFCITCLVWFAFGPLQADNGFVTLMQSLSRPDGWLVPGSMWLALGLTLLSGWNYMWNSRSLLRGK
jgi:CDP-diacylglycerol--glycerol-3-phosphate 3-phosphatidyltransferase